MSAAALTTISPNIATINNAKMRRPAKMANSQPLVSRHEGVRRGVTGRNPRCFLRRAGPPPTCYSYRHYVSFAGVISSFCR